MRHQVRGNRLNRPADHRRAMLRNMVVSLFKAERITTTVTRAKAARRYAERMITFAKRGDLHARRQAARFIVEPGTLQKLFDEIGPRYADRPGGYTRVIKAGIRKGDDAQMAILELVEAEFKAKPKRAKKTKKVEEPKVEAKPVVEEAPVEEPVAEDAPAEAEAADESDEEKKED